MTSLLLSLSLWVGQADRIQTVTLDLFSEQVATVEAREYQPGKFAVDVTLNAPCAKALAELTKTHMGSYFRLKVAGQEALFAQVYKKSRRDKSVLKAKPVKQLNA